MGRLVNYDDFLTAECVTFCLFSFSQYVTRASSAVRGALKEPAKLKVKTQEAFSYNVSTWSNGVQSSKTPINKLAAAGK
jgi:Mitochondrial ATP synthase epsilon chain